MGDSLQFPFRFQPSTAGSERDNWLLQDGDAHNSWDPSPFSGYRESDTNSNASSADAHSNSCPDAYAHTRTYSDANPNSRGNPISHSGRRR